MRTLIAVVAVGLAGFAWTAGAQQVLQPKANQGSGVVTIGGTVDVGNTPSVKAGQLGDWTVSIANTPAVTVAAPEFLKGQRSYEVTWTDGTREVIVVERIGRDGWVRVDGERWVNVALARSLQARR
jgi:membrane-bound ClpP family serine protease